MPSLQDKNGKYVHALRYLKRMIFKSENKTEKTVSNQFLDGVNRTRKDRPRLNTTMRKTINKRLRIAGAPLKMFAYL